MDNMNPIMKERSKLLPALLSKCEEFAILGYHEVTEEALWMFMIQKKWRKRAGEVHLHQLFNDIMRVSIGEYMNYATIEGFKKAEKKEEINMDAFRDLFS
ncbi:post-transcriptional regulator [Bacillus sp. 1P06AnD]|uniref:post-transcriptional regulator n=1 Tax=Bacillus sp. 1P06AnD TaxID=3132208 RepID=UPI0039A306CC